MLMQTEHGEGEKECGLGSVATALVMIAAIFSSMSLLVYFRYVAID